MIVVSFYSLVQFITLYSGHMVVLTSFHNNSASPHGQNRTDTLSPVSPGVGACDPSQVNQNPPGTSLSS